MATAGKRLQVSCIQQTMPWIVQLMAHHGTPLKKYFLSQIADSRFSYLHNLLFSQNVTIKSVIPLS